MTAREAFPILEVFIKIFQTLKKQVCRKFNGTFSKMLTIISSWTGYKQGSFSSKWSHVQSVALSELHSQQLGAQLCMEFLCLFFLSMLQGSHECSLGLRALVYLFIYVFFVHVFIHSLTNLTAASARWETLLCLSEPLGKFAMLLSDNGKSCSYKFLKICLQLDFL